MGLHVNPGLNLGRLNSLHSIGHRPFISFIDDEIGKEVFTHVHEIAFELSVQLLFVPLKRLLAMLKRYNS